MKFFQITRWKIILAVLLLFPMYEGFTFVYNYFFCDQLGNLGFPRLGNEPVPTFAPSLYCTSIPYFVIIETIIIVGVSYLFSCLVLFVFRKQKKQKTK